MVFWLRPNSNNGLINQIKKPQPYESDNPNEITTISNPVRWYSDELPIPTIQLNDEKYPCKSADMIDEQLSNEIFSYSSQLLNYISLHRKNTDCHMIRKVITALTSTDIVVIDASTKQIEEYIERNEIT